MTIEGEVVCTEVDKASSKCDGGVSLSFVTLADAKVVLPAFIEVVTSLLGSLEV
jgi:hypothetical protein